MSTQFARSVYHARRGEMRKRYREEQEEQLGMLGLVDAIVLWNTLYRNEVREHLRAEGLPVSDADVPRLLPHRPGNVDLFGRYSFDPPPEIANAAFRPHTVNQRYRYH